MQRLLLTIALLLAGFDAANAQVHDYPNRTIRIIVPYVGSWNAMFVSAGTPPDIVLAIQQNVAKSIADPKVRALLVAAGQEPVGNTPEEFDAMFKTDLTRFATVIEQAKIPKLD